MDILGSQSKLYGERWPVVWGSRCHMGWGWSQCGWGLCRRRAPCRCCPPVSYCPAGWSRCPDSACLHLLISDKIKVIQPHHLCSVSYSNVSCRWLTSRELASERAVDCVLWAVGAHRCPVSSGQIRCPVSGRHRRHRAVLTTLILKHTRHNVYLSSYYYRERRRMKTV